MEWVGIRKSVRCVLFISAHDFMENKNLDELDELEDEFEDEFLAKYR